MQIFGEHEQRVIDQLARCAGVEEGARAVLCADGHLGYSQPIGGAVAYREHVSPSGVGYDIGCGNKAVRTDIAVGDLGDVGAVMDEIYARISFGIGRNNGEAVDHAVLDRIRDASFAPQRDLLDLAADQLGTVGAGNHYVDLFADSEDRVWVGLHFGSRGFGHKTASGFLALAAGQPFDQRVPDGEMDSPPIVFAIDSDLGQAYIDAMTLAGEYAHAGRDVVVDRVLEILGAQASYEVHNHHNYAWREQHDGEPWWVVRKGCTPAFPGQQGFVGATMGEDSVILQGTPAAEPALFSTVHGAGRAMSRTQAAGKTKRRKIFSCPTPGCDYRAPPDRQGPGGHPIPCAAHPDAALQAHWAREQTHPGRIDWAATTTDLAARGIQLRGGAADEAPGAYKRLTDVLDAHGDTIRILHRLRPIGVAMAAANTYDPFKE